MNRFNVSSRGNISNNTRAKKRTLRISKITFTIHLSICCVDMILFCNFFTRSFSHSPRPNNLVEVILTFSRLTTVMVGGLISRGK